MRIGIFFGGPSREREISFLGGKTVFNHLSRALFTPVPIFVDSTGHFVLLDPVHMTAASLRELFPPAASLPKTDYPFQVYEDSLGLEDAKMGRLMQQIGKPLHPAELSRHIDFAFLMVHGPQLEDGAIQGLLEWYGLPYQGSGLLGSAIGIDKIAQNDFIRLSVGLDKRTFTLTRDDFNQKRYSALFEQVKQAVGLPFVVKAPHQGSSIGVAFVKKDSVAAFEKAVRQCFFEMEIRADEWKNADAEVKGKLLQGITNLDEGIAFPLYFQNRLFHHPDRLWKALDKHFAESDLAARLVSLNREDAILFESFVEGQEFSCGVLQDFEGKPLPLPPTEIAREHTEGVFDFQTKYLKNVVRKYIPVRTSLEANRAIHQAVSDLFELCRFGPGCRIDGFLTPEGRVLLHDPNTLPGMSPMSLIFKQTAQIGLNITDTLTYLIRFSLRERMRQGKFTVRYEQLLDLLDAAIAQHHSTEPPLVGLVFKNDRELAEKRLLYTQLTARGRQTPMMIWQKSRQEFYAIPPQLLVKENCEELAAAVKEPLHPLIEDCRRAAREVVHFITGRENEEVYFAAGWSELVEQLHP